MGFYIECGAPKGKVAWLKKNCAAVEISVKEAREKINDEKVGVICVVDNIFFEAAGFCFRERELEAFTVPSDSRPRTFLAMDRNLAEEMSGYKRK